ncbi:MAG TPA: hypothetical protein G4N92_07445 [Anaerolineae bacterium]|nr:hypothetical protein [Anaerolineae bacterium]
MRVYSSIRFILVGITAGILISTASCARGPQAAGRTPATPTPLELSPETSSGEIVSPEAPSSVSSTRLEPLSGTYFGVNLDWAVDSPALYNERLGRHAAVYVRFFQFPLSEEGFATLDATVDLVAVEGGMVMITLEPWDGLEAVTLENCRDLADRLRGYNARGVPIFVRFAHEMNGSWYPWSQQPSAYIKTFQTLAGIIHKTVPQSAMVWAPNYGGGYPFSGGQFEINPEDEDFKVLDTNQDGIIDMSDDPYLPYYPGDNAVDWVGMSLYHWGGTYPWGENEIPEANKFISQLSGKYISQNGDDSSLPDFYELFYTQHGKPLAIPETAAFYDPAQPEPDEILLKMSWWRQVFDQALLSTYPGIKMINWFEWNKPESEVGGTIIDWRTLGSPAVAEQFRADLPIDLLIFAP